MNRGLSSRPSRRQQAECELGLANTAGRRVGRHLDRDQPRSRCRGASRAAGLPPRDPQHPRMVSATGRAEPRQTLPSRNLTPAGVEEDYRTKVQFYMWDSLQYNHLARVIGRHLQAILDQSDDQLSCVAVPARGATTESRSGNAEGADHYRPARRAGFACRACGALLQPNRSCTRVPRSGSSSESRDV